MSRIKQSGFSLITAIFLIVVLATLMGYMVNLRVVQQATVVMSLQGARAMQAARSGVEYGMYKLLGPPGTLPSVIAASATAWCATPGSVSFTTAEPALESFTVTLQCSQSDHDEGGVNITSYRLSALAENGNFSSGGNAPPDYVSRQIRLTVTSEPPP